MCYCYVVVQLLMHNLQCLLTHTLLDFPTFGKILLIRKIVGKYPHIINFFFEKHTSLLNALKSHERNLRKGKKQISRNEKPESQETDPNLRKRKARVPGNGKRQEKQKLRQLEQMQQTLVPLLLHVKTDQA